MEVAAASNSVDLQFLCCPMCKNEYDFDVHAPKLLDCKNTICLNCLKQVKKLRFRSKFKCVFDKTHKHKYPKKKHEFDVLPNEQIISLLVKFKEYNKKLDEFEMMLNNFDQLSRNQMNEIANSKSKSVCPKCHLEYNSTTRVPRLLDNTKKICSNCIKDFAKELNMIVKECQQSFQTIM